MTRQQLLYVIHEGRYWPLWVNTYSRGSAICWVSKLSIDLTGTAHSAKDQARWLKVSGRIFLNQIIGESPALKQLSERRSPKLIPNGFLWLRNGKDLYEHKFRRRYFSWRDIKDWLVAYPYVRYRNILLLLLVQLNNRGPSRTQVQQF